MYEKKPEKSTVIFQKWGKMAQILSNEPKAAI
jgi:hypothetical protein